MARDIGTVVILGGSIAGLLAAAAAARHAERVVLVERDVLEADRVAPRRGVPQGKHNHNLSAGGRAAMRRLLPGLDDAVRARGGHVADLGREGRWTIGGHRLARATIGHESIVASRPCMDAAVLACVRACPRIEVRDRTDVLGIDVAEGRVRGVRTVARDVEAGTERLEADLVVDAMGRGSRLSSWLGLDVPTEQLDVRVSYATRQFRRRAGDLDGAVAAVVSSVAPGLARGGVAFAIEDERWSVLLFGYGEARPPLALDAFRAYARTLAANDCALIAEHAEPLGEGEPFRYPRAVRHRYDQVPLPEGLFVIGDALVSTNPAWAAGMTSAALQARALDERLAQGIPSPSAWHRAALAASRDVWDGTTSNDRALDAVPGRAPLLLRALVHPYVRSLAAAAAHDADLSRAFLRVVERLEPPQTVLAPSIVARVLGQRWRAR